MKRRTGILAQALLAVCLVAAGDARGQSCPALSEDDKAALSAEHLFGGPPSSGTILIRRGYAMEYDAARRVPRWTAALVAPSSMPRSACGATCGWRAR